MLFRSLGSREGAQGYFQIAEEQFWCGHRPSTSWRLLYHSECENLHYGRTGRMIRERRGTYGSVAVVDKVLCVNGLDRSGAGAGLGPLGFGTGVSRRRTAIARESGAQGSKASFAGQRAELLSCEAQVVVVRNSLDEYEHLGRALRSEFPTGDNRPVCRSELVRRKSRSRGPCQKCIPAGGRRHRC